MHHRLTQFIHGTLRGIVSGTIRSDRNLLTSISFEVTLARRLRSMTQMKFVAQTLTENLNYNLLSNELNKNFTNKLLFDFKNRVAVNIILISTKSSSLCAQPINTRFNTPTG